MDKVFDIFAYLMGKAAGGGGGDITVESKSITANGTYTAPPGKAYSPVTVDVPNSYAAGDEGKVVSNGALVSQTAHAKVTSNGTIDTTLNNSVEVDVALPVTGTITLAVDTIGQNMPTIDTGIGYSHFLIFPNQSFLGFGSRTNGGFHYWVDTENTYVQALTTNSSGSSGNQGGDVSVSAGVNQKFNSLGQKVGNTFVFSGDASWNGYYRSAITYTWFAW